ncbi:hypothetical protein F1728_13740 [Gimesia benthica]|uniref:HEAT repeat domain-containing protein n=1 Tax=Gimesia benthica TaxID=2608982 RepID=A0A6I6AE60_9PLAN|nr:hypothetical protein [Gimesia benthica]QGQ23675.1 hypothetical protein F1728_13740 [Gimesia benthica]
MKPSKFYLKYNRSGLGCLLLIIGTPVALFLFWHLAPSSWILRLELQNQLERMAYDTSCSAGPEAIPLLQEYLAHQNANTRFITVSATGAYIGSHQESSQPLITAICNLALHDKSLKVRLHAISTLRQVFNTSTEVDHTVLELMNHQSEAIRFEARELLLIRIGRGIEVSTELCTIREQLKPALETAEIADPDNCAVKNLKTFLEKCDMAQEQ